MRRLKYRFFILLSIVIVLLLAACGSIPGARNYPIEPFSYTNQDGNHVSLDDLKGKVWVADFIFTNCADVCLPMTVNMAKLQKMLNDKGIKNVEFVSFSVDPDVDSPEVLKEFAERFDVDFSNWHFLTGYDQKHIEEFAKNSFKAVVLKPDKGDQVIHTVDFYLVNQDGAMVKYYTGLDEIPFDDIIKHIKILQKQ